LKCDGSWSSSRTLLRELTVLPRPHSQISVEGRGKGGNGRWRKGEGRERRQWELG